MPNSIVIVTGTTPGLLADAEILREALKGRVQCTRLALDAQNNWQRSHRLMRRFRSLLGGAPEPIVFMETAYRSWMHTSPCNILIPNLEWMYPETEKTIAQCSGLWCKSYDAQRRLAARGLPASYLGFTSRDRLDTREEKSYSSVLHLAGRSPLKGTAAVLAAWQAHPEWPSLTLVARAHVLPAGFVAPSNVDWISAPLSDAEVTALMNRCGVHLCPSEAEGFGHYIGEAMSCESVVVTTDAPPMNEHLSAGEGLLVPWDSSEPLGWAERYRVTADALADTVEQLLCWPAAQRAAMGKQARSRYLQNRQRFEQRAPDLVDQVLGLAA